ncbi:MAG: zinc-ribbon domain-containing protein, partial [Deltaproteobacteria bacterium]|nr:zinc-ribbon domain-containing protein [Deltaproteobacteria bacterium]
MRIVCPQCHFSKNIDSASIPDAALMATCPKCKTRFPFTPGGVGRDNDFAFLDTDNRTSPGADTSPGESARAIDGRESYSSGRETGPDGRGIPWENPGLGSFSAFFSTIKAVLFRPGDFYTNMPVTGGLKPPLIFGLVLGSVGMILPLFWSVFWSIITFNYGLADLPGLDLGSLLPFPIHPITATAVIMGCIPVLVIFSLLIWSIVTHILLTL